jgi:hypothetical protein
MRWTRAYRVVVMLLIVAPLLVSLAGPTLDASAQSSSGGSRKVIVDNEDRATAAEIAARGGYVLVDYGSFSLWSVPDQAAAAVQGRASIAIPDKLDTIALRGGATVDTKSASPAVPAHLQQTRTSGGQLWLVQFVGPIKEDWLNDLRNDGLELVTYMPYNAYVVWGDGAAVAKLDANARKSAVIQFTGEYHPAYRLEPSLQQASQTGSAADLVSVTVQLYTTKDTPQSLANLRALGGEVYRDPSIVTTLTDISLDLPKGQLTAVANWPDVFNVEPFVLPERRDEAQGQIVAGNLTTSGPNVVPLTGVGQYLAFLSGKGFPTTPSSYPGDRRGGRRDR